MRKKVIVERVMPESSMIPAGKIRCYVTGKYRPDTPEEHVRQRMARSLVEEYGYSKSDIELEFKIVLGSSSKRADIVVFSAGSNHTAENIVIIVEAKKDSIKPTNKDNGIEQLKSYLSASPNCRYGLWVGSEIKAIAKENKNGLIHFNDAIDIPFADGRPATANKFSDLVPATDVLKDVFKRCHNYISANQGGSKEAAFHEFLKIIFCKVFDEKYSKTPQFYINTFSTRTTKEMRTVDARIQALFKNVCDEYGYIFGKEEKIDLKSEVISYIVGELQKYSLLETDYDYKGQAYEEIVGNNSRGERGEFFTPRNLCQLAVNMCRLILGDDEFVKVRLLDPSCGTGGFLKTYIHALGDLIYNIELDKWHDAVKAKVNKKDIVKAICDKNVFGIDFNPVLVMAAQMNLVMHGDGSSNIYHENSLKSNGEYGDDARKNLKDASFDLILSNPPFGEDLSIDDSHILDQYELSSFEYSGKRGYMAPQELFIERSYRFLKPNGLYAIVTPDNIVSNPSYRYIRHWILLRFRIIASVSLPTEMFQPSTGTQTTLLILKKRAQIINSLEELRVLCGEEHVFLSIPHKIGHDLRGNMIPLRDEDGNICTKITQKKRTVRDPEGGWKEEIIELQEPIAYDMLPQVFEDFKVWFNKYRNEL